MFEVNSKTNKCQTYKERYVCTIIKKADKKGDILINVEVLKNICTEFYEAGRRE